MLIFTESSSSLQTAQTDRPSCPENDWLSIHPLPLQRLQSKLSEWMAFSADIILQNYPTLPHPGGGEGGPKPTMKPRSDSKCLCGMVVSGFGSSGIQRMYLHRPPLLHFFCKQNPEHLVGTRVWVSVAEALCGTTIFTPFPTLPA